MSVVYVHLSDIHFGQEKGGDIVVHDDVKDQLLIDARDFTSNQLKKNANGIIISGDIVYAGKNHQYETAGRWIDRLTTAVGCDLTAVQVVPGNHDIDRERVTPMLQSAIDNIIEKGDSELDRYMEKEDDREFLYKQFSSYRTFAEGYNCPLDHDGRVSGHRIIEIAPGKKIKFHGVNTALICSNSKKEEGRLLLGKRQRVLPIEEGVELVVIGHHPLNWLQDSEDAKKYLLNRARVFISGHEHNPSHKIEVVSDGKSLLMLASGATVPPEANAVFNYCYNILEFEWNAAKNTLDITIHARMWNDEDKFFGPDGLHYDNGLATYSLSCPNFKKLPVTCITNNENAVVKNIEPSSTPSETIILKEALVVADNKEYDLLLYKFFRELSSAQRLTILIKLGAIPDNWTEPLTHSLERRALDQIVAKGDLPLVKSEINKVINNT